MSLGDSKGKKLVVRLQYADVFQVTATQLDSLLTDIRKDQSTAEYICSLASRLNTTPPAPNLSTSNPSFHPPDGGVSQTENGLRLAGSCGIEALASAPSDTFTYYAKTAPRDDIDVSSYKPTVVVEVFSNEDVDGLTKANNILGVIKQAVEDRIIKQQSIQVASSASICLMNFLAVKPPQTKDDPKS